MAAYGMHGFYAKGVPSIGGVPRRVYVGEIGKRPLCYVDEKGDLFILRGSIFDRSSVADDLPQAFGVSSSKKLFAMFFPPEEGTGQLRKSRKSSK